MMFARIRSANINLMPTIFGPLLNTRTLGFRLCCNVIHLPSPMAFESFDHFAPIWCFFLSRHDTRNWLCDPSDVMIGQAQYPPVSFSMQSGEAQLVIFGQDGPVSLGALVEDIVSLQSTEVAVHRSALAVVPGSDLLFIVAFRWCRVGTLLVQFGTVTSTKNASGFKDVLSPHHVACKFVNSREFDPPSARAVVQASRLGDYSAVTDTMFDTFPNTIFPSQTTTVKSERSQSAQNHYLRMDTVLPLSDWSPVSEGDQGRAETISITSCQIIPEEDSSVLYCDADRLIGLPSFERMNNESEFVLPLKEHSFMESQRNGSSLKVPNIKVEQSFPAIPQGPDSAQWLSSRWTPKIVRSQVGVCKKSRTAPLTLECPTCGVKIRGKRGNLNRHIAARHEDTREFSCALPACDLSFHSKLNLLRHMTRVHEGRPHRCKQCPRAFRSADNLSKHLRNAHSTRREFVCNVCAVGFGRRSVLDNHISSVHGDAKAIEFTCALPTCAERFESWKQLAAHESEMHGGRVHQCTQCTTVFETECMLSRHIRTDHGHTEMSCKCPVCGCFYSKKSNLLRHFALAHKS